MKKNFVLVLLFVIVASVISYFIGYKKAYDDYESFINNNDYGVVYQSFYATITNIDGKLITVKGMDINDINFRGNYKFYVDEVVDLEWRYTDIKLSDLEVGDNISIIFTGSVQETDPAKITDILKVQLLDDEK